MRGRRARAGVVDGSHSWLLADPGRFGEVITNDLEVAKAARAMETETEAAARTRPGRCAGCSDARSARARASSSS